MELSLIGGSKCFLHVHIWGDEKLNVSAILQEISQSVEVTNQKTQGNKPGEQLGSYEFCTTGRWDFTGRFTGRLTGNEPDESNEIEGDNL